MELYKSEIIKDLQNAVNQENYRINSYTDYDFLTHGNGFYSNGLRITLNVYPDTGRREAVVTIKDYGINNEYVKRWKETAIGNFFIKDWKTEKKDIMGNVPYYTIEYTSENGKKMCGIIRLLIEYYMEDLPEEERHSMERRYADIKIDKRYYSVIKLWSADDAAGHFATTTFGTNINSADDEETDNIEASYIMEIPEDDMQEAENISETLF